MARYSFRKVMKRLGIGMLGVVAVGLGCGSAIAQIRIVPDSTLGPASSDVIRSTSNPAIDEIWGGDISGTNLLHSFEEFNVEEGRGVYFYTAPSNIENIFSRVTGNNPSEILGVLGTSGNSVPNLWLINPNGILFGPSSQLNLGGAFLATTANEVQIEGIGSIAASNITDNSDILRIDSSAFIFNRDNPNARIINQSQSPIRFSPILPISDFSDYSGLEVLPGQDLGFVSRYISLQEGGINVLHGDVFLSALEDVELTNGATVQAGNVLVDTNRLSIQDGSQILTQFIDPRITEYVTYFDQGSSTFFDITPDESFQELVPIEIGDITISARESVTISGVSDSGQSSRIGTGALGALRTGGNITLESDRLTVSEGGRITSNYLSVSDSNESGGAIDIDSDSIDISGSFLVPESADLDTTERLSAIVIGGGVIAPTDGSVSIRSEEFSLLNGARIIVNLSERKFSENTPFFPGGIGIESTSALISGASENNAQSSLFSGRASSDGKIAPVTITSNLLTVQEGAVVLGQDVNISASEILSVEDDSIIGIIEENKFISEDSSIQIGAQNIQLQDNARIQGSEIGISVPGTLEIKDDASVGENVLNRSEDSSIQIEAQNIRLRDNARIQGNEIELSALDSVEIDDSASVGRNSEDIFGRSEDDSVQIEAQSIRLQNDARVRGTEVELLAIDSITLGDRTQIFTDDRSLFGSQSELERVSLSADRITLDNEVIVSSPNVSLSGGTVTLREQAIVSANQQGYGSSGDISINVDQLNILDSAQLSASIDRPGSGGSIDINARDAVNVIGDVDSPRPSSVEATTDGPGTGGQVAIRTRQLNIQNGSQIVASLNGGGTGGSVVIEAEESVNISGESKRGQPSGIFADSNLENGEFVVLRSIREDGQSPQFISMLLDTEVILFTQASSLIRSIPRTGNTGSNQIFLNYNPADDDPRSAESLFPKGDDVGRNRFIAIDSVGSSFEQSRPTTEAPSGSFDNTEIPTNQSILTGSTVFNTQEVGTARQVLFSHFNVPDRGVLITGQSMSINFSESIQGGERIFPTDTEIASLVSNLIESLESIKDIELVDLEDIETDPDEFAGPRQEDIFNDLDAISSALSNDAGELYIIESTGEEFRIRDNRYTDTRFTDIQAGDRFLVFAVRDGGDISIETDNLTVRDGAAISTTSRGASTGNAAASQLDITANSVLIENNATISAISETGSGGNISVRTSDMRLNDSTLTASAEENATGGNITINAENGALRTDNGSILSSSDSTGGGNVTISAGTIRFDGDSDIQADVSGGVGDGGNINLTADYIIAFDDSDIFANAEGGSGGVINLNTPGFFGDGFTAASLNADPATLQGNDRADINATGVVNGVVTVPDVNSLENSLTSLPDTLIAPDQLIASSCIARADDGQGNLITTGGDGLANSPDDTLNVPLSTGDVQAIASPTELQSQNAEVLIIDEPTGVYQLADGRLVMGKACL